jgi:anti-sigma B factor antagonist
METSDFDVQVVHEAGRVCIKVSGDLDFATAPELRAALDGANSEIVIDFARLTFLDAAGLGVLAQAHEQARRHGHRVVISHAGPMVRRLLTVTGLDDLL